MSKSKIIMFQTLAAEFFEFWSFEFVWDLEFSA
jgi:hypothetical protein